MELHSVGSPLLWAGFIAFVFAMLAIDLGVFHRKSHVVRFKEAAGVEPVVDRALARVRRRLCGGGSGPSAASSSSPAT